MVGVNPDDVWMNDEGCAPHSTDYLCQPKASTWVHGYNKQMKITYSMTIVVVVVFCKVYRDAHGHRHGYDYRSGHSGHDASVQGYDVTIQTNILFRLRR